MIEQRAPPPVVRSARERLIQTLWFEGLGLAVVSPLLALFTGASAAESIFVLAAISLVVMGWSALYNTAFDLFESRRLRRLASNRPRGWRIAHTVGLEATVTLISWPLIVALTPLGWRDALVADFALTLAYIVYGFAFHLAFDRLRPVRSGASEPAREQTTR